MKQKYQDNGGKSLIKIVSMNFDEERGAPRPDFADLWGERGGGGEEISRHRSGIPDREDVGLFEDWKAGK